ncbi:MAG: ankyrin repeat domain-containing protein [Methylotenera sp.]
MKHPLFESLGDKYPFCLEERFDRILVKIEQLWDSPEINDYFSDLIIDKRGGRQGFPKDVMDDILQLIDFRESVTIRKAERKEDAIRDLERRGISVNKDQFFKALLDGDKELIDLFVRSDFNIHTEDAQGTPAILIAMKKGYTVIGNILLNAGADVNARDRIGLTPLLLACGKSSQGYKEIAEMLIKKGANINVRDRLGYTPLLLSLSGGVAGIAELLIERGADVYALTRNGENALSLAEKAGNTKIAELLRTSMKTSSPVNLIN